MPPVACCIQAHLVQATYIDCITFIANKANNARVFLEKDVSKALRKLGYTMKVTSTIAYLRHSQRATWIVTISIGPGLGHLGFMGHQGGFQLTGMSSGCISIQPTINQVCRGLEKHWFEVNDLETMKSSSSAQT
jgi:hypothetical protein